MVAETLDFQIPKFFVNTNTDNLNGAPNAGGVGKIGDFRLIFRYLEDGTRYGHN